MFKNDKMIWQRFDSNQNRLCSNNNVSENFANGYSINQYRIHHNGNITQLYEEIEFDTSDHYIEIQFDNEEETNDELLDFKTELELFNKNFLPQHKNCIDESQGMPRDETYSSIEYEKIFPAKNFLPENTEIARNLSYTLKIKDAKELKWGPKPKKSKNIENVNQKQYGLTSTNLKNCVLWEILFVSKKLPMTQILNI